MVLVMAGTSALAEVSTLENVNVTTTQDQPVTFAISAEDTDIDPSALIMHPILFELVECQLGISQGRRSHRQRFQCQFGVRTVSHRPGRFSRILSTCQRFTGRPVHILVGTPFSSTGLSQFRAECAAATSTAKASYTPSDRRGRAIIIPGTGGSPVLSVAARLSSKTRDQSAASSSSCCAIDSHVSPGWTV